MSSINAPTPDWDPPRRHLRCFAWSCALVVAILAEYQGMASLRVAAAGLFAAGTILPRLFRLPYAGLRYVLWVATFSIVSRFRRPRPYEREESAISQKSHAP